MTLLEEMRNLIRDALVLDEAADSLTETSQLLGAFRELDSVGLMSVVTAMEERYDIEVEDHEITPETFETLGSLTDFPDPPLIIHGLSDSGPLLTAEIHEAPAWADKLETTSHSTTFSVDLNFIGEPGSRLYNMMYWPDAEPKAHIVFVPPFCEEMNRCRTLVASQAREFASAGFSCSVFDFLGTGDSEGQLDQVNLKLWLNDINLVVEHALKRAEAPLYLWGLRLGALLAVEFAQQTDHSISKLILWQPVVSGKKFITQLLRLRVAHLANHGLPAQTTQELRSAFETSDSMEISGYTLGTELLREIDSSKVSGSASLESTEVLWLENLLDGQEGVGAASKSAIDGLAGFAESLQVHTCKVPPIWQLPKRSDAPELVQMTRELIE
jgi:exosortase A-associated hydrolase 2